ncbi:hypothetical protein B0T10DRAFT_560629 [Thelonectria olida]|uniref:DUF7730 domain-containing protein n=1 Tax=Thelonectria olida TaxID=1576542 RepID=A0A9P9AR45_9HYPO|nr:hypothetical protein B0T10DRAFT_560629 [Thelonectria olida]
MASTQSLVQPDLGTLSTLPLEIRRLIYKEVWDPKLSMHLYFRGDQLSALPCLGAHIGDETEVDTRYPSREECDLRWEKKPSKNDNFWISRLSSSWGHHYRCEEDWMPHPDHPTSRKNKCISTLLVCEGMYHECIDFIHESLEINVTDLETAMYLVSNGDISPKSIGNEPCHTMPLSIIRSVRTLNLTFFQPPEFYIALGAGDKIPVNWGPSTQEMVAFNFGMVSQSLLQQQFASEAPLWREVWSGLTALPHLVNVNLWMDHDQPHSWSCVNERAVLQPLCDAEWASRVNLKVHLPNLRQDKATPAVHFTDMDCDKREGLPFKIRRRYRCPTRPEREWWGCSYEPDISDEEMVALGNEYGADMTADRWTTITILISQVENRCYRAVNITSRVPQKVKTAFRMTQARLGYKAE